MACIENEIYEYLCELNCTSAYCMDIRFTCFGDSNKFYSSSGCFEMKCVDYAIEGNTENVKAFIAVYLDGLWAHRTEQCNRIALLVNDITEQSYGYKLSVGVALFEDPSI